MNYNLRQRSRENGPPGGTQSQISSTINNANCTSSNNNQFETEHPAQTTSSRSDKDDDLQEQQHYNRINNNHVIDGPVGPDDCPSFGSSRASLVTAAATSAADDDCEPNSVTNPTLTPTMSNGSNESPSKSVDSRIPVYV